MIQHSLKYHDIIAVKHGEPEMIKKGIVLAAGEGTRVWPYASVRSKVMIPIANKPLVSFAVDAMKEAGVRDVTVACSVFSAQIASLYQNDSLVTVLELGKTKGTADTLIKAVDFLKNSSGEDSPVEDGLLVLNGDSIVDPEDVKRLCRLYAEKGDAALVSRLENEDSRDWICCKVNDGCLSSIAGHPRRDGFTHRFCAFAFSKNPPVSEEQSSFSRAVGTMPPEESYIEMSVSGFMQSGGRVAAAEAEGYFIDVDKPWHILAANEVVQEVLFSSLSSHELAEGATVDKSADISGFVRLGEGSRIGRNVR